MPFDLRHLSVKKLLKLCNNDPCHKQLGIEAVEFSKKQGVAILHIKKWHRNMANVLHGGILFSVMDTTMGLCVFPHLHADERILGIDLKINFLKAATLEMKKLKCHANLVTRTSRLAISEGELLSPKGEILCKALGTFAILKRRD